MRPARHGARPSAVAAALTCGLLLLAGCMAPPASSPVSSPVDAAVAYLAASDPHGPDAAAVLQATGGLVDPSDWPGDPPLLDRLTPPERYADLLRLADGLQRHGLDPRDWHGTDLIEAVWDGHDGEQFGASPSIVDDAWALRVLGAAGEDAADGAADDRIQDAVARLGGAQAADGGWSWDGGESGDTDVTVWVVEGLAAVGGLSDEVAAGAEGFLRGGMGADGLWSSLGVGPNCQSTGLALWGFHVLDVEAPSPGLAALRACQNVDGGFPHRPGATSEVWVTTDVLPALAAYADVDG